VISFENLVMILPMGLESKNRMFALKILLQATLCILVPEVMIIQNAEKARANDRIINNKIAPAKRPGYNKDYCCVSKSCAVQ
jgi:hypothetical protein